MEILRLSNYEDIRFPICPSL